MAKLICYKGCSDFLINGWLPDIPDFYSKPEAIRWKVQLGQSAIYTLPGREQEDWNKGGGVSFFLFNHHRESTMWSWRYLDGMFEYGIYSHVDGEVVKYKDAKSGSEVLYRAQVGDVVNVMLRFDWSAMQYKWDIEGETIDVNFTHNKLFCKEITANFGGNYKAPKKLRIDIETIQTLK